MCNLKNTHRLICMLILVAIYFVVELATGYATNSIALIADAFHMLSDFLALLIGLAAIRISAWPRSSKNTFGWQRAEVMGGLVNSVILATLCFTIFLRAIERFIKPDKINDPKLMIYVGGGGLLINLIGLIVLGGHSHGSHSHGGAEEMLEVTEEDLLDAGVTPNSNQIEGTNHIALKLGTQKEDFKKHQDNAKSMNMRGVFLHVLADFFGSIVVMVSALILHFVPGDPDTDGKWKLYVDPAMSLLMVVLILLGAVKLMYHATLILLQSVPQEVSLKTLKSRLEDISGIQKIHDLHVWRLQSNCIIGTVHIRCVNLPDYLQIAREVKLLFHEFNIHCTTIQPEFDEYPEDMDQAQINYQACVLDCGPNKGCQSDTCCPAPSNGSCIATYSENSHSSGIVNKEKKTDSPIGQTVYAWEKQANASSNCITVTTTDELPVPSTATVPASVTDSTTSV